MELCFLRGEKSGGGIEFQAKWLLERVMHVRQQQYSGGPAILGQVLIGGKGKIPNEYNNREKWNKKDSFLFSF